MAIIRLFGVKIFAQGLGGYRPESGRFSLNYLDLPSGDQRGSRHTDYRLLEQVDARV